MTIFSFNETQRFRQPWIWVLLLAILMLFGWAFIQQIVMGIPWGNNPTSDYVFLLFCIIPVSLIALFLILRLDTQIDETGVYYRYFPLHFKKRKIDWSEIDDAHIRKYKPISEYGGWGIRYGFKGGVAYNVSGKSGLQLKLIDGKRLLIGTQKPKEIELLLKSLKEKTKIFET